MKHFSFFLLLCSLFYSSVGWAQATFVNPSNFPANAYAIDNKRIDDPSSPVVINQGASQSKSYELTIWRTSGVPADGTIKLLYGGNSQTNLSSNALVTLTINNFAWAADASNPGNDRQSFTGNISLSAADASSYTAIYAVYYQGSSSTPTEISHPIYISVAPAPTGGSGTFGSTYAISPSFVTGEAGSYKKFSVSGQGLNTTQTVVFNGQYLSFTATATNIVTDPVLMPAKGDYTITFASTTGRAVTITVHVVTPLATFFPCSSASNSPEICFDQCVSAGSTIMQLSGRVLAQSSDDYDDYNNTHYWEAGASDDGRFGSPGENEQVQWQYSLDNNSYFDIAGATQRNYQPSPVYQTTYFRRVSTHIEGNLGHRAFWYNSNVVTISVKGITPVPVASTYGFANCGNTGQTLQVAVNPSAANKSLNWWVPISGWTVNGFSTVNNNASYVTTDSQVSIAIPAGTPNGTYTISVSANGDCGMKSADATITVNVNQDPPGTPNNISFQQNYNTTQCYWYYDVFCAIVPGATSYHLTDSYGDSVDGQVIASGGYVTFPANIYGGSTVTVNIVASNACGNGQVGSSTQYLDQANPQCDYQMMVMYPNPTTDQVKLSNGGLAGQATFFNAQGTACKTVTLHEKVGETSINLLDLPNGTYHVQVISNGKVRLAKQLVITH